MSGVKRATVYFEPEIHGALRLRPQASDKSISDMVNDAVKLSWPRCRGPGGVQKRKREPNLDFEQFVRLSSGVASYSVLIKPSAAKEIEAVDQKEAGSASWRAFSRLLRSRGRSGARSSQDRTIGTGSASADFASRTQIADAELLVLVVRVADRRDVLSVGRLTRGCSGLAPTLRLQGSPLTRHPLGGRALRGRVESTFWCFARSVFVERGV